jgi:hypothetical protein
MNVRLVEIRRIEDELRTEINTNAVNSHSMSAELVCELVRRLAERWNLSEELFWRLTVARREEDVREKLAALG